MPIERIAMDKATFERMHAEDRMATDKLKEGIEGFSAALVKLEGAAGQAAGGSGIAHARGGLIRPRRSSKSRPPSKEAAHPGCLFCVQMFAIE